MLKRLALAAGLILVAVGPVSAWTIPQYDVRIEVQPDSSVEITEIIVADFTGDPHRGIYREIPFVTKDRYGNKSRIRNEIVAVTDQHGTNLTTQVTNSSGRIKVRIGDPDILLQDRRTYVIKYRLLRAVHFFDEQDEIYWNAIGDEWQVPVENAVCEVILPPKVPWQAIRTLSFSGVYGSTSSDTVTDMTDSRTVRFRMTRPLIPGEGLTVVVGWPKGIVTKPETGQEVWWFATDNGYFFLPPVFILFIVGLWLKAGRDPDTSRSVAVAYDPPDDLRPAEVGTLIDERADMKDISATIIDLAVRGLIKITAEVEKGFLSTKTDYMLELQVPYEEIEDDPKLTAFERRLIRAIFSCVQIRMVSDLSNSFYIHLPKLREDLYDSMMSRRYFSYRPDTVRTGYRIAGFVMAFLGVFLAVGAASDGPGFLSIPVGWGIAVVLCGIVLAAAAGAMPRKTTKGRNALLAIKGFEEYLSRAERGEIEHQERQNYFEKFLPYAMALGIADKWAKAFDGLQTKPPDWYSGDGVKFRPTVFASDLTAASRNWGSAMASQPRSSGSGGSGSGGSGFSGGSSGGGGGGGGGGAW